MAAKKKVAKSEPRPGGGARKTIPGKAPATRVEEFLVDNPRALVTLGPAHEVWKNGGSGSLENVAIEGAIIRLHPPTQATDNALDKVQERLRTLQAARIIVVPRNKAVTVPVDAQEVPMTKALSARQVVSELVDKANPDDRDALRELCETTMAQVGL